MANQSFALFVPMQTGMAFVPVAGETNGFQFVPSVIWDVLGGSFAIAIVSCCLFGTGVLGVVGVAWYLGMGTLYWGGGCLVSTAL